MTKRLTKAEILSRSKVKTLDVEVPEWAADGEQPPMVTIKAWGIRDADRITHTMLEVLKGNYIDDLGPQIAAVSIVDEDGNLMFGTEEGVEELSQMAPQGLSRITNAALHFNKLGYFATDEEGKKQREERQKERAEAPEEDNSKN